MERTEIFALVSLLISIFLILKVLGLQSRVNELRSDVARLEGRPESYPLYKQKAAASVYVKPLYAQNSELSPELEQRLRFLLADGKKIVAIKELRVVTGLSLKDAKDFVDAMEKPPQ